MAPEHFRWFSVQKRTDTETFSPFNLNKTKLLAFLKMPKRKTVILGFDKNLGLKKKKNCYFL